MSSSVNEQLLEIKTSQRAVIERRHRNELAELERDIAVLKRAIEMERELITTKTLQKSLPADAVPQKEKLDERREKIVAVLREMPDQEVHHNVISERLGMNPYSLKDWMQSQIKQQGEKCPWTTGSSLSVFKLKPTFVDLRLPEPLTAAAF